MLPSIEITTRCKVGCALCEFLVLHINQTNQTEVTMNVSDVSTMHPSIAELARELLPMIENPVARPTSHDRVKLMTLREEIKRLPGDCTVTLTNRDEIDRRYLYVEATKLANQQEDFYEKNGKWEPMTKERLIEMGGDAPLDELLNAFPIGNLSSFAGKELPNIRRALRVRTIGELNAKIHAEALDAQELKCGNKTLEWIDAVCREFKIGSPKYGEPSQSSVNELTGFMQSLSK